jgi:hypothetical protein
VQDAAIRLFASEDEEEEFDDGEAVESDAEEARRSSRRRATGEVGTAPIKCALICRHRVVHQGTYSIIRVTDSVCYVMSIGM